MLYIETVDLSLRGVALPWERVGMVIAQPHIPNSSLSVAEPYQFTEDAKRQQMAILNETLAIARSARHGALKTHFTVFPEYSIPGLEGIELVESAVRAPDWPTGTVVIGGTDALTQMQYAQLLSANSTYVNATWNGADQVGASQWVNCAITWVKAADGTVERWVQLKVHPAREEFDIVHQHMFCGRSVFLFSGVLDNGVPYRFGTLICFDWIAIDTGLTPWESILNDLQGCANGHQLPLSWLFVIQRNKRPSHDTFLNGAVNFFNQTKFPNALRDRACLVFSNTAGRARPGRANEFGASSAILSPQSLFTPPTCLPTYSKGGPQFRDGSNILRTCRDAFFRERGACIHSFAQINPGSLIAGSEGMAFPLENAHVFPVSGVTEPRAPAAEVPAPVKWLNDDLDEISSLSAVYATPLAVQIDLAHQSNIVALRGISSQSATQAIRLSAQESTAEHADKWGSTESKALKHLLYTLDIISVGFAPLTVDLVPPHASCQINGQTVDIIAIRGTTHSSCFAHVEKFQSNSRRQVIIVSRDPDNNPNLDRFGSFLRVKTPKLGEEPDITDPGSRSLHLGYRNLLDIFQLASTPADVQGGISAKLSA